MEYLPIAFIVVCMVIPGMLFAFGFAAQREAAAE